MRRKLSKSFRFFIIGRKISGQSMMEYILLTAVAIICLLAVGYLNKIGGPGGVFEKHFNKAAKFIVEGG